MNLLEEIARQLTEGDAVSKEIRSQISGKGPKATEEELKEIVLWYGPQVGWSETAINKATGIHLTRVRRYVREYRKALDRTTEGAEEKLRQDVALEPKRFEGRAQMIDTLNDMAHECMSLIVERLRSTKAKELSMPDLAKLGSILGISIDKRLLLSAQETKKLAEADHRFADDEELKRRAARNEEVLKATELKVIEGGSQ